jgi:N-acyl-phosphatidylethanolamine-hydrolysing phospholipase D
MPAPRAIPRILGLLAGALLAGAAAAERPSAPGFAGAPRDAEGRFLNRAGAIEQAGPLVTIPFFLRRGWTSLVGRAGAPERVANDGAFLRENAGHSVPTLTWVGHATVLVQMDHVSFLTDPIWSERASPLSWAGPPRFVPPGLALDDLPPLDFVLISHDHYDHLDLDTLAQLAARSPATRFLVPLGNGALLREAGITNVAELDWGGVSTLNGVDVHCLPSQHWSRRGAGDLRRRLWAAWAVVGRERRLYFSGDAGYSRDFADAGAALGPFDVAVVPIGAYQPAAMMRPWHLDPEEAVRAGLDLRARQLVPIHFGTFDLSDEPLEEPPRRFRAAAAAAGFAPESARVLRIGETRPF